MLTGCNGIGNAELLCARASERVEPGLVGEGTAACSTRALLSGWRAVISCFVIGLDKCTPYTYSPEDECTPYTTQKGFS